MMQDQNAAKNFDLQSDDALHSALKQNFEKEGEEGSFEESEGI